MRSQLQTTRTVRIDGKKQFDEEILPSFRPTVIKDFLRNWPALEKSRHSPQSLVEYIQSFDTGRPAITYRGEPSIQGHFFYQEDLAGVNFERIKQGLSSSLDSLLTHINDATPPALYTGAVSIADHLAGFETENKCELAGKTAVPRIWIGNQAVVPTHYDMLDNIVCVVAGRRRFTLFPPEQISNLYVGPIDFTLSGQPISLVNLNQPDFSKYPKFKQALETAEVAELEPGDALYIPKLWWHHVESFSALNVIVNYWWDQNALGQDNPFTTMMHGLITISHLPQAEREAWLAFFQHYIFRLEGDPAEHINPDSRGVLSKMTPEIYRTIRHYVATTFSKR